MKEYPPRPKEPFLVDICECGHRKHHHTDFELRIEKNTLFGKCENCLCPDYKFEQKLTIKESWKLDKFIENKAGFAT